MAIPFNLPSDEETEDNYRRLDQLLLDLYHVLRQILMRPRCEDNLETRGEQQPAAAPSGSRPDVVRRSRHQLPDVVESSLVCHCRRRRHRRRRRPICCPAPNNNITAASEPASQSSDAARSPDTVPRSVDNWLEVGEQLRKIAEEFKTSFRKPEVTREKEDSLKMEVKTSGLFSLLVPSHFRSSIWTTVILLVGWRLLVRAR